MSEEGKREEDKKERRFSQEQYEFLKKCSAEGPEGIKKWNEWRKDNFDEGILLEGADLRNAYLEGADLRNAYLEGADFEKANLQSANLNNTNLQRAFLMGANLQSTKLIIANMQNADFQNANLQGADLESGNLRKAYLVGANLKKALLARADLQEAKLEWANLQGAILIGANLQETKLDWTNLQNVQLMGANLQSARLWQADLQSAWLTVTNLAGANLALANIQGVDFTGARLQGTDFYGVIANGKTLIEGCLVDRNTEFQTSALGNVYIEPELKQLLEYNARRINWKKWYKGHRFWRWPVQAFWAMSDYGMSTLRVVAVFFVLALLFAAVYMNWAYWSPPGIVSNLVVEPMIGDAVWHYGVRAVIRPIYFSVVTMTTLGFGDMYANKGSIAGHVLLILQVILGYVLLGALVTRFAVLFTAGGPAGKFAKEEKK